MSKVIKEILTLQVEVKKARLDKVLAEMLSDYSRSQIQHWIHAGLVQVNGVVCVLNKYQVTAGDQIIIAIPQPEYTDVQPENIPLHVLYEDTDLAIINKVSGMVVHPAPGHSSGTLVNALLYHLDDLSGINGEIRPGIVHRLDKKTSGALVIAKNDRAHRDLSNQLKERSMKREYLALIHGEFSNASGTINAPIKRDSHNRQKYTVASGGKEAITHFEVVEHLGDYTLVRAQLETGRTHQIRVHFRYIHHPVVGDELYGPSNKKKGFGQYLHAHRLGFIHPSTREYMEFIAPLPQPFEQLLTTLRKDFKNTNTDQ